MLQWLLSVTALLSVVIFAQAEKTAPADRAQLVRARTDAALEEMQDRKKKLTGFLKRVKNGAINKTVKGAVYPNNDVQPFVFPSKELRAEVATAVQAEMDKLQDQMNRYKAGTEFDYGVLQYPPQVGDFGRLYADERKLKVKRVLDQQRMLVEIEYEEGTTRVLKERSSQTVVKDSKRQEIELLVKNVSTKGATDKLGFTLPQVFEVTGTERVKPDLFGPRTVFVVEPLDTKPIEALLQQP